MAVAVVGAALAAWHGVRRRRTGRFPLAIGLYIVVSIGGEVYSSVLQRFVVTPNEQVRETPFIQHNIAATRRAFGLDNVEERAAVRRRAADARRHHRNAATLENVRLWDHQPLLETFGQIQEIRTYYDFVSVDNDRYRIDGTLRQVMLSARELNSASLPNRTWVNERLTFTHGYGLTLGPVNQVTSEGLPVLFVRDLPPRDDRRSEDRRAEPLLRRAVQRLRDRPHHARRSSTTRAATRTSSTRIQRQGRRAARLALAKAALRAAVRRVSDRPERRHRRREPDPLQPQHPRARRSASRRSSPSTAIRISSLADGRLYWMFDAYTTSTPLSVLDAGRDRVNYIRNSVKFVIDAYDGTTTAYLADADDPIAATYARIFPGMFKPLAEMPATHPRARALSRKTSSRCRRRSMRRIT